MNKSRERFARKAKTEEKGNSSTYIVMLKALIMCFIFTFVMVMLYALVLSLTSISDSSMPLVTQTIIMIGIVCASIYGGKRVHKGGWILDYCLVWFLFFCLFRLVCCLATDFVLMEYS